MTVKGGPTPAVSLGCRNQGADLVIPNIALLSWLEQQAGQEIGELFNDETGEKPWMEIISIARRSLRDGARRASARICRG